MTQLTSVAAIDIFTKLISSYGVPCPKCGTQECTRLLSTTNQWDGWCKECDIRFNRKGEEQDPITLEKKKVLYANSTNGGINDER